MDQRELAELTAQVIEIAKQVGSFALKYQSELDESGIGFKTSRADLVTWIDRAVETRIVNELRALTPAASFECEELSPDLERSDLTWVIDPIDGTRYYARGLPMFATSIALIENGRECLGVIRLPASGQTFYASSQNGAFRDGFRLHCSTVTQLEEAIVYIDTRDVHLLPDGERQWFDRKILELFRRCYRVRTFGAATIGATWVASKSADAFIDLTGRNKSWDVCAAKVLLLEAGTQCEPLELDVGPPRMVAANSQLRARLAELLSG